MPNPLNYEMIIKDSRTKVSIDGSCRDLNVFIPVRGRHPFLVPCLNYLKRAGLEANINIAITIIENDEHPQYEAYCTQYKINYIFVPNAIAHAEGMFAKALAYNIGFLLTERTEWNVFHDLDILVEQDFFKSLLGYMAKCKTWIQPYSQKRVVRLNATETGNIVMNPEATFDLKGMGRPANPGSPGGSIVVRSEDFINVGGYDPEYFYGYSPEDAFFWAKLEVLHKVINEVFSTHFQGSAMYADDPVIDVYHMDHPNSEGSNNKQNLMLNYLSSFYRTSYDRKRFFIDTKRANFIQTIEQLRATC